MYRLICSPKGRLALAYLLLALLAFSCKKDIVKLGAGNRGYSVTGKIQSFWKLTPLTVIPTTKN